MTHKIAICDDQILEAQELKLLVSRYFAGKKTYSIDVFYDGKELLISEKQYDLILLDIDMPVICGIETAKQIRQKDKVVDIIYITNYTDYHKFAFSVYAFSYLIKPVCEEELFAIFNDLTKHRELVPKKQFLVVKVEGGMKAIDQRDIFCIEFEKRKVKISTKEGLFYSNSLMKEIYSDLNSNNFAYTHRGCVINLGEINFLKMDFAKNYVVELKNKATVSIARTRELEFREKYNEYLQNCI